MNSTPSGCLTFAELGDYWTPDAPAEDLERIESHVFQCTACARLLAEADLLRRHIGALTRGGGLQALVTDEVLNRLARDGVRVRTYALGPGEAVECAAWDEDEVIVARLRADLSGVTAVDVVISLDTGEEWGRSSEMPVRAGATELILAWPGAAIRSAPAAPLRLTLQASSGTPDRRPLGEYVFDHRGVHHRR